MPATKVEEEHKSWQSSGCAERHGIADDVFIISKEHKRGIERVNFMEANDMK